VTLLQQVRPTLPRLPDSARPVFNSVAGSQHETCMVKPFSFIELHARVPALLRRNNGPISRVSQVGDLILDREQHRVERNGQRIDLTTREFELLEFLMGNAGRRFRAPA
jgi:DNA-binding response OmpR family regulator